MVKQTAKTGASKGRKKVAVKDLEKSEKKLSSKQMKKVKGGNTLQKKGYALGG